MESQNAVLGVHCGHDAGACIIVNGKVIADAQEERFTRQKHCSGIPYQSVWFCLEQAGIEPSALKVVATSHRHFKLEHFFLFPETPIPELKAKPASLRQKLRGQSPTLPKQPEFVQIPGKVEPRLNQFYEGALKAPGYFNQVITNKSSFIRYGHHECHAATAYYTSKALKENREALVVVLDGIGDDISVSIWKGLDGRLQMIKEFGKEYSLGFFYSTVTEVLGYQVLDGEGTTMGQAPYGVYNEAIAETLARDGAKVIGIDVGAMEVDLARVMTRINGIPLVADITAADAGDKIAAAAKDAGGVDLIVHNAGVTRDKMLVNMSVPIKAKDFASTVG